jgi:uncharacterized small protein (DUF1192 family)
MTQDRMADRPMLDKNAKVVETATDLPERLRHYNPQSELMLAAADRIEDADRRIAILESVIEKLQCELAAAKAIPREPTDDMLRAGINLPRYGNGIGNRLAAEALDAAIDAAISGNQPHTGD